LATEPVASRAMSDNQHAALVMRDSVRHRRDIEKGYLEHIDGAHEEVLIACAYFLPGRSFRRALIAAVARGTRVVLLLQAHDEYALLQYGSRALYGALLDAGIEIREYHRGFLHAKVAVFDRRFACVGSSNIDPFSMLLALEANLFVDDRAFAEKLRESLQEAMSVGSNPVPPDQWKRRPLGVRAQMWIAYAVVRLLAGLSGYERNN
jgi:cardiolipin synthase